MADDTVNARLHHVVEQSTRRACEALDAGRPADAVPYLAAAAGAFEALTKAVQYAFMIHLGQNTDPKR